jgi:hypothetical protein
VSCLKKALGKHETAWTTFPTFDDEGKIVLELEGIVSTREKTLRSRVIKESLINWKSLLEDDASWETKDFRQQHLSLPML